MENLTNKQQDVYNFVMDYRAGHGYSPSLEEIAVQFDMTQQGASSHLRAIIKKGWLRKAPGKNRSLTPALTLTRPSPTT